MTCWDMRAEYLAKRETRLQALLDHIATLPRWWDVPHDILRQYGSKQ